jgi:hypothetical protein
MVVATSVADAKVEWHHVSASVVLHVRDRYPNTDFKYSSAPSGWAKNIKSS